MKASRRQVLAGALTVPALAGVPKAAFAQAVGVVVVHDPALDAGRRLAAVHGGAALAIDGDRIRFARAVFEKRPELVVGVSRPADALLIEDVAREAGYRPISSDSLQALLASSRSLDRGLVVGWVLGLR